jgi:hypothetical protein
VRADNTRHIIGAARQRRELTRAKAIQALRTLAADGTPVTFETVARAAAVSRSWLYAQPDIRAEIEQLRTVSQRSPGAPVPPRQRASGASLLRRLEVAAQRNRELAEENRRLRDQLARALGAQRSAEYPRPRQAQAMTPRPARQGQARDHPGDQEPPPTPDMPGQWHRER